MYPNTSWKNASISLMNEVIFDYQFLKFKFLIVWEVLFDYDIMVFDYHIEAVYLFKIKMFLNNCNVSWFIFKVVHLFIPMFHDVFKHAYIRNKCYLISKISFHIS